MYKIIDIKTGAQVGKNYQCRRRARQRANKLDLQYGAIRYVVRPVDTKQGEQQ